ncbi:MAG TPA: 5-dehydro-2-deoxygluconokinase [Solirubrobacteraceae bacterium]|jgi:5-dehydro-2-deoxygluconokinase|nr:5-dehydro-2-deoxygluconokinase [Solirubrobacteraceae bacterium]
MTDLELLTVGRISIDLYCGQLGAGWNAAQTFAKAVGGSPTNVAIAAARLGRRAALYTKVGADPFGEVAVRELRDFGVDTAFVGVEPDGVTPLAFAVLDPPEDPQLHFRRQAPVPDFQLRPGEVPASVSTGVGVLWISGGALAQEPCRSTVQEMLAARKRATPTILDLDYRPSFWRSREEASEMIGAAVNHATIAVGNREECAVAVGTANPREAAARLLERGVELAIVKLGGDGVLLADAGGERTVAPAPIEVLCGLGAGDAFGGALCHGLLSGWAPERAVAFANAAGGIVASRLLCSAAMPYEAEVLKLVEAMPA